MQPWKISAGLTAALAGSTVLLAGPRLGYLAPFWPVILADHGVTVVLHMGLACTAVAAAIYGVARSAGLADLGRRVDLVERSVRRGEGDPELSDALRRDAEGGTEPRELGLADPQVALGNSSPVVESPRFTATCPAIDSRSSRDCSCRL